VTPPFAHKAAYIREVSGGRRNGSVIAAPLKQYKGAPAALAERIAFAYQPAGIGYFGLTADNAYIFIMAITDNYGITLPGSVAQQIAG
jgi:hypothetical protein